MSIEVATHDEAKTPHARAWVWPMFVVLLLSGSVVSGVVTAIVASRDPSVAIEEHYYEKSMHWDEDARARAASDATGWLVDASIDPASDSAAAPAQRTLRIVLTTRDGVALAGAHVEAEVFHMARRADAVILELAPEGNDATSNAYSGAFDAPLAGRYRVRLRIDRGPEHFVRTLDIEAADSDTACIMPHALDRKQENATC
ncbi:MAG: FixH family protein [Phycisphaerales bacterium]|jgi:hypothetical protein|nr:FixH family protein [Phycisphaerales bacterium]